MSEEYCWITGDELTEMLENEDFQWIWGVWQNPVCIQHPLAEIEIIAWDSSMTVFISKDDNIADLLKRNNILAEDVEKYNE